MTKHSVCPFLIPLALLCTALPVFGSAETLPCADRSVTASAVHTPEDVKSFVQCAYEFVQEMGFEEARQAFNEDGRWKSGPIYIFVSEATPMSDQARLFVFPPARSREGSSLGLLIDAFGNDYYKEQHRIVSSFGAGWLYYSFTNPATGRDEPKYSYIKKIDWEGNLAAIGAGIYRRDIPGTCESEEVSARGSRPRLPTRGCRSSSAAPRWSLNRRGTSPSGRCQAIRAGGTARSTCSAWTPTATRCSAAIPTASGMASLLPS